MTQVTQEQVRASSPPESGATADERTYATLLHVVSGLTALLGTPLISVAAALVMWLIRRERSAFVDDHGREALNFWISMVIYGLLIGLLGFATCGVGWALYIGQFALGVVGTIMGAVAANEGRWVRLPMTIRVLAS